MNIVESWKKQVTFLQSKDSRTVFFIALKRYIHVLLSAKYLYFMTIIATSLLFSRRIHNITDFIFFGLAKMQLSFAFFSIILFLRPSTEKKDWHYLKKIIKKKEFMMIFFALCSLIIPVVFIFPFLFIASTILLLSLDGEYEVKDMIGKSKNIVVFLIYNFLTIAIISFTNSAFFMILQHVVAIFIPSIDFLRSIAFLLSASLFSLILLFTIMIFVFAYTVSIYENDRIFFDL